MDLSNDTEIIAKVQKTAEILMIFKVHTYVEQTVCRSVSILTAPTQIAHLVDIEQELQTIDDDKAPNRTLHCH